LEKWKSCDEVTGKTGKEEKSQTLAFSWHCVHYLKRNDVQCLRNVDHAKYRIHILMFIIVWVKRIENWILASRSLCWNVNAHHTCRSVYVLVWWCFSHSRERHLRKVNWSHECESGPVHRFK
jgi:hypothetical protein